MKNLKNSLYLLVILFTTLPTLVSADILWEWSFATESGTFITTGTMADLGAADTFYFNGFNVSASSLPANVGSPYQWSNPSQGVQGILWDGSQITQYFREGGTYTNGSNFFRGSSEYFYTLIPSVGILHDPEETVLVEDTMTVTPMRNVRQSRDIPSLSMWGLATLAAVLAITGIMLVRRRA